MNTTIASVARGWFFRNLPKRASFRVLAISAALVTDACPLSATENEAPNGSYADVGTAQLPLRLWVEESGEGDPVLLIHGLGASTFSWRHLVASLARTHRIIAVDLKGAGKSDKPVDEAYGLLDQAALLRALLDQKNLANLTIVGHSLGGGVALALALELNRFKPGTLKQLALISTIAYRQRLTLTDLLKKPSPGKLPEFKLSPELIVLGGLYQSYYRPSKISFAAIKAYARPLREPGGEYALIKMAEHIVPPNLPALVARYRTIEQPTLLIWCAEDQIVPISVGKRLARDLPHARLEVLKGCGHVPQEEEPEKTLVLLKGFLK